MENKTVQRRVELDEYHNHKHVLRELRGLESILSKIEIQWQSSVVSKYFSFQHTATVAAISAPTPPVIGAS